MEVIHLRNDSVEVKTTLLEFKNTYEINRRDVKELVNDIKQLIVDHSKKPWHEETGAMFRQIDVEILGIKADIKRVEQSAHENRELLYRQSPYRKPQE